MSEMVERVAAAIMASPGGTYDAARAAIQAMREPTGGMLVAKWSVRWPASLSARAPSTNQAVWSAMIDAALKD
jgi:hypothetical protein